MALVAALAPAEATTLVDQLRQIVQSLEPASYLASQVERPRPLRRRPDALPFSTDRLTQTPLHGVSI